MISSRDGTAEWTIFGGRREAASFAFTLRFDRVESSRVGLRRGATRSERLQHVLGNIALPADDFKSRIARAAKRYLN